MDTTQTAFDAITKDKPTLAGFLRSLPVIEAPWDAAFQKRYCSSCTAKKTSGGCFRRNTASSRATGGAITSQRNGKVRIASAGRLKARTQIERSGTR